MGPSLSLKQERSIHILQPPVVANTRIPDVSASYLYADDGSGSANSIAVFRVGANGNLTLIQEEPTGGFGANNIAIDVYSLVNLSGQEAISLVSRTPTLMVVPSAA